MGCSDVSRVLKGILLLLDIIGAKFSLTELRGKDDLSGWSFVSIGGLKFVVCGTKSG